MLTWFPAQFDGGRCGDCGHDIKKGDMIAVVGRGQSRRTIRSCCTLPPGFEFTPTVTVEVSDDEPSISTDKRTLEARVMPTGRKVTDRCPKCFLIHSRAQGDECQ